MMFVYSCLAEVVVSFGLPPLSSVSREAVWNRSVPPYPLERILGLTLKAFQ